MDRIVDAAEAVAGDHAADGTVVLPRSAATSAVKKRLDVETVSHDAVRAGFDRAGWRYGRNLYFHPGGVRDRCRTAAAELLAAGHLLVTHARFCDEIAGSITHSEERGWEMGPFVETVRSTLTAEGWAVTNLETAVGNRTVYVYPLDALIAEQYPRGLTPHSPRDLFTFYVSTCIQLARGRDRAPAGGRGTGPGPDGTDLAAAITGIGPTFAARLRGAGIDTVADLAAADPETVADVAETGPGRARDWIEQAREQVGDRSGRPGAAVGWR